MFSPIHLSRIVRSMISRIEPVSTLDAPGLEPYRTLRRPLSHRQRGLFIAEGSLVVLRFLESPLTPLSLLMTPEWLDRCRETLQARPEQIPVFIAEKGLLETIVGFHCHQGIMAIGAVPPAVTPGDILRSGSRPCLFAAVDGLTSAENTGVLVRNCAACGVQALIAGETSADPFIRRAVRNSMGTLFKLPVVYAEKLTATLRDLRTHHGFRVLAAHPRSDSALLFEEDLARDCCIVFGSEGDGISPEVLAECDRSIAIPMAQGIDSFNVACASAVVLYEAMRQRAVTR
jgi:tRNA G18 (ribose-2'-O)-methylase SpoU